MLTRHRLVVMPTLFLAFLLPVAARAADDEPRLAQPAESFPIVAWYGPPESETTLERYRELAEAGFTHNLSFLTSADAAAKALDIAHEAGLKLIVACPELLEPEPEQAVKRFREHPALAAYHLRDEPSVKDFPDVAAQIMRVRSFDERHPCYVNMFPNYGTTGADGQLGTESYQEYLDRYVHDVPVEFLSFDHYPIVNRELGPDSGVRTIVRPGWYANLQAVTTAARAAGKPVWAFALSVPHDDYPPPTAAHLRLQVHSNLAYGVQALQYFTYWTPTNAEFDFHDAPIAADGTQTAVFELVRELNCEVQARRGVFLGAKLLAVGHTGQQRPEGTEPYIPAVPVRRLTTSGGGAIVSQLEAGERQSLVIVNRDIDSQMVLAIDFERSPRVHLVETDGRLRRLPEQRFEGELGPGEMCAFTWDRCGTVP